MYIEKLEIKGFGKIKGLTLKFNKGLNVIYGGNESGKSTIQLFIQAMLYGLKGGRASRDGLPPPSRRFKPWNAAAFGGAMECRLQSGILYRIERDFENNSVGIYDFNFNNVSSTFEISKEKGLMFAEKHLGLNEACFEKTLMIKQMETKLDSDGSRELSSRLANVSQTGYEDISFKKAEKVLKETLKSYIGTDKTTTQPIDRINAKILQLKNERNNIAEKRDAFLDIENKLNELNLYRDKLLKKKGYLEKIKELIDCRKQIEELSGKLTRLKAAELSMQEIEERVASANEQLVKLKEENKESRPLYTRAGQRKAAKKKLRKWLVSFTAILLLAISIFIFIAVLTKKDLPFNNVFSIFGASGFMAAAAALELYLFLKGRRPGTEKEEIAGNKYNYDYEEKMQEIMKLNGILKDTCSSASLILGKKLDGAADLSKAITEVSSNIDGLKSKINNNIEQLKNQTGIHGLTTDFFVVERLDSILDSGIGWLEDSWEYEMDSLSQSLNQVVLDIKECEVLKSNGYEGEQELQSIDEEIELVSTKKNELEKTAASIKLALEVLNEASSEIRRDIAPVINKKISCAINNITGGRYRDLRADDLLALNTIEPETGDVKNALALSGGTMDQMYLALRFAMADLFIQGDDCLPFFMDEIFAQYDDFRTRQTLKYMRDTYGERQIVLFTCKKRELELIDEIYKEQKNIIYLNMDI